MRARAALAEEVLALVAPRERAAAVAGDLVEESNLRGRLWLCTALLGTAAALFVSAFGACRVRVLARAAAGLVVWFGVYALLRGAGAFAGLQSFVPLDASAGRAWSLQAYLAAILVLSGLVAGAALGRRPSVRGVNGAAPLAAFWISAAFLLPLIDLVSGTATWYCTVLYVLGLPVLYALPLAVGGALGARAARGTAGP